MKRSKGFTLIELLAVIVILGILLSVTTIAVGNIKKKQDRKNYENVISSILTGAKQYASDNNMASGQIRVNYLSDGNYADFDQSKYSDLKLKQVKIERCDLNDYNNLKRKFSITVDGKTYNDCGCEEQISGSSSTLCVE